MFGMPGAHAACCTQVLKSAMTGLPATADQHRPEQEVLWGPEYCLLKRVLTGALIACQPSLMS